MSTPNPVPTIASWIDPTTNTDGSPIAEGEITGYELGVRDTTSAGSVAGTYPFGIKAPATATSEPLSLITPVLPTGVALAAALRANTAVNNSDWTPEVTFTLPAPAPIPNPPSSFGIA